MDDKLAFNFWKNLDSKRSCSLLELVAKAGVKYNNIKDQRSQSRLPKLEDAYALSQALGVSLEYLLTGADTQNLSPEAKEVESSPELRALVRAVLRDSSLIQIIGAVVESSEKNIGYNKDSRA